MNVRPIHNRSLTLLLLVVVLAMHFLPSRCIERPDSFMLSKILNYPQQIDTTGSHGLTIYAYTKYTLTISKRNLLLLAVPNMFSVAHGKKRKYVTETYEKVIFNGAKKYDTEKILELTTIPHHEKSMSTVLKYMTPEIYNETVIDKSIFSPFHTNNYKFYKYSIIYLPNRIVRVTFKPRYKNTQLVEGQAMANYDDGRIISATFSGEYDMIRFNMIIYMGENGIKSLMPKDVRLFCNFNFMGNHTKGSFRAVYDLPQINRDSCATLDKFRYMEQLRPITLNAEEQQTLSQYVQERAERVLRQDSLKNKAPQLSTILWGIIGDNLVNRIKSHFGNKNQGYIRINPIMNPLYMEYDHKRGFTYKINIRTNYLFTPNRELNLRFKGGYAFKQEQFYFGIPMYFYYNKRRNGYVNIEVGNGNWIRNRRLKNNAEQIIEEELESQNRTAAPNDPVTRRQEDRRTFFKNTHFKIANNYDISDNWSFLAGFVYHSRSAVEKSFYKKAKLPTVYKSVAPMIEWQWRPKGWDGPYITLGWERGIKKFLNGDINYEQWELDGQWILKPTKLDAVQMRMGTGFYTRKDGYAYFLDYSNFRANNIPGGWNDDWSCEFELLGSDEYNISNWYVRSNLTYETPILVVSHLPWVGKFVEMERIYLSCLGARKLHPHLEVGLGFTTRLFSMGLFVSHRNGKFKEWGCKFGFELFRRW